MTFAADTVRYVDAKRWMWLGALAVPLIPAVSAAAYAAWGNALVLLCPLVFVYGVVPAVDAWLGEDAHNPPEAVVPAMAADPHYRRLLLAGTPLFYVGLIASAWLVGTRSPPLWAAAALAVGVGVINGGALIVGHELGHKASRLDRVMALLACSVVGYGHFCVEHNRGHHVWVSTPEDPASSRMGESVYAFALREVPGAFRRGWEIEIARLKARGRRPWSPHNEILQGYAVTLAVNGLLVGLFGWIMIPFLLIHHLFGWYGLTQANYVEHYGLLRARLPDGRYEPCRPRHSWNTNHIFSNLLTFHLQRHSDHHANPMRPYQALRDFPDLPRLPSGYPGCYLLAAIPPLWFRVMDPRLMAWAGGDLSRVNARAGALPRLGARKSL